MWFSKWDGSQCQKRIQQVLIKRELWPGSSLNLESPKPQCYNCEQRINCKLCIKGTKCKFCKVSKVHTGTIECIESWKYDGCIIREAQCICISKKYCVKCTKPKGKYGDYKDLPPKYNSDRKFSIFLKKVSN